MYIQPPGVPFAGNQGAVAQPVLPTHIPSLQYFPSASIPSTQVCSDTVENPSFSFIYLKF